jgi:polyisoprenoid-binding protein YceI
MSEGLTGSRIRFDALRFAVLSLLACVALPLLSQAQAPVFKISTDDSSVKFYVKASVALTGTFKLKSKDFFDVKQNPTITFHSTKIVKTGPNTFDVSGDFTIRGVTKPETLTLTVSGIGTGTGEIKGTMAFDRKDYGMTHSIPFVTIADRIEVTVDLIGKRVSGPPLVFKEQ